MASLEQFVWELKGLQTQMAEFKESQDSVHTILCKIEKQLEKLPVPVENVEAQVEETAEVSAGPIGPPPGLSLPPQTQAAPQRTTDSVSSPVFNLPACLSPI